VGCEAKYFSFKGMGSKYLKKLLYINIIEIIFII
jgi:hypothetical protein